MLAVGAMVLTPTLIYTTTALRTERVLKESLINEYNAEAAFEWGMWQLLYTDNIDVDEGDPIWEGSLDINGETIPLILTLVSSSTKRCPAQT
ncbi:hypothetical protein ACFLVR_05630 [Chloroflexota bacterium]